MVGFRQTNQKTDTGKTLTRWPVFVDHFTWGGLLSLILIPVVLLNTGTKAPTQSLLGKIAVKIGPLEKPFTRADLHKLFY